MLDSRRFLTLFSLGFLKVVGVLAAYNSRTINDVKINFGRVVENHKLIKPV